MQKTPVAAIFDVGKTNKKLFLFDENYKIVYEKTARFTEIVDEDGEACENVESLRSSVRDSLQEVLRLPEFQVQAINFSAYGASIVCIDEAGEPVCPLYSYLKPYPEQLRKQFYDTYGGEEEFSKQTASPVLGSLNSGMQIYRIRHERPELFDRISYALHLPQYISYLVTGKCFSDLTSIGCHTNLWDFRKNDYHEWVRKEGVLDKLAPIAPSDEVVPADFMGNVYKAGIGLHDSSAALIPYLVNFQEPFVLLSTGTWCISLNPFNTTPLTEAELQRDCLSYMQYKGKPVKASRFFGGYEHEQQTKRIAEHFNLNTAHYKTVPFDAEIISRLQREQGPAPGARPGINQLQESVFTQRSLSSFDSYAEAYHQFILDLVKQQVASTQLVLEGADVKRIFVDGGFGKNPIYMNLLAAAFPDKEVFAASMAQATAVGTALAIHRHWNSKPLPNDIIELKYYAVTHDAKL